jgi:general secretion pathway protein A
LGVPANDSGDWTPTLTEKVKLFQRNEKLQQDGVPGKDTLIRLRQALGEAPRLINETSSGTDLSAWLTSRLPPHVDKQNDARKEVAK